MTHDEPEGVLQLGARRHPASTPALTEIHTVPHMFKAKGHFDGAVSSQAITDCQACSTWILGMIFWGLAMLARYRCWCQSQNRKKALQ